MATPVELIDIHGHPLTIHDVEYDGVKHSILAVSSPQKEHGLFFSTTLGAVATTILATPTGEGYIELTDLIITTEKKTAAIVTIQFNDGTNQEIILTAYCADAPVNLAIGFSGGWSGWQGAYVEVDVAGAAALGSVAIGYLKHVETFAPTYTEWVERRA